MVVKAPPNAPTSAHLLADFADVPYHLLLATLFIYEKLLIGLGSVLLIDILSAASIRLSSRFPKKSLKTHQLRMTLVNMTFLVIILAVIKGLFRS